MQQTRLNTLLNSTANRFTGWFFSSWRRISLVIINLLFGYFFAIFISSIAGQSAYLDVTLSAIFLLFVELVSWLVYSRRQQRPGASPAELAPQQPLLFDMLNAFKIGLTYSLFVEAFKLAS